VVLVGFGADGAGLRVGAACGALSSDGRGADFGAYRVSHLTYRFQISGLTPIFANNLAGGALVGGANSSSSFMLNFPDDFIGGDDGGCAEVPFGYKISLSSSTITNLLWSSSGRLGRCSLRSARTIFNLRLRKRLLDFRHL
jgi:hypothetical protein